ncbi:MULTISPECIES: type II secretion system F family protein [Corynebacterium]|uniref:Type II secretion protein F n=1 Tax=Corynebacterium sanguinis TaxID=2594913 RepID=A0A6C1TXP6_9CORY|nr:MULTISPECIES: type II secretion system F family protein [Corynebacterium]MCT1412620.1 type II secretion system F family protein [Corynebacterium sanguinis]MCT1415142.1 type II secretion system F family protein [Corynebacterium sanguinis]MCT1443965.1 type II secretion system F family protein [Corynebacterium sanguinis]MCT1499602.1 type II secretion system F family protein [Corynebacterium sanguinis]MCT1555505.1 type II secretion system F family protein [Corynebacterium sanguinis]
MTVLAALLIAGALCASPPRPAQRLHPGDGDRVPKTPRDGPRTARSPTFDRHRVASDISLFAACFSAGLPVSAAAAAVADSYGPDSPEPLAQQWRTVAALSVLGVEPDKAWADFHRVPGGAELASLVGLSHSSGTAVAAGCERIASRLRDAAADDATARAERAGVLISIPLTAFFLPAFFVLGLIPTAISLGTHLTQGVQP